jgi:hypothetical protein
MNPANAAHSMPMGSISQKTVQAALNRLRSQPTTQGDALLWLSLVEQKLLEDRLPDTSLCRSYALSEILITIITHAYHAARQANDLTDLCSPTSLRQSLEAIKHASETADANLLGWLWFFYHYVHPEFDISVALFCETVSIHTRTLSRYHQRTLSLLLYALIDAERRVHVGRHQQWLLSQLPGQVPMHVYGREKVLQYFTARAILQHVQINGPRGIGKTALTEAVLRSWIVSNEITDFIWLHRPSSVRTAERQIANFAAKQSTRGSIRQFVQDRSIAIVLDGVEHFCGEIGPLQRLLADLRAASVFLISQQPLPIASEMFHLMLSDLPPIAAKALIRESLERWNSEDRAYPVQEAIEYVWELAGGNPAAILRTVLELRIDDYSTQGAF